MQEFHQKSTNEKMKSKLDEVGQYEYYARQIPSSCES